MSKVIEVSGPAAADRSSVAQSRKAASAAPACTAESACTQQSMAEKEAALARVLASAAFSKAKRLSAFLEFVCRMTLEGRQSEINEVRIGANVFQRQEDYNVSEDTIVRTTARLLRQRLEVYYDGEGRGDTLRIEIPRGAYVPTFEKVEPALRPTSAHELGALEAAAVTRDQEASGLVPMRAPLRWQSGRTIVLLGLIVCLIVGRSLLSWQHTRQRGNTPEDRFWATMFPADRNTLLVPADTMLLWYEVASHQLVDLDQYSDGHYLSSEGENKEENNPAFHFLRKDYARKRYTAVTSVAMAVEFAKKARSSPERLKVRFARDIQPVDLKESNVILLGAGLNNPWERLFEKSLNFHLDWQASDDTWRIRNDHPQGGEPTLFPWVREDPDRKSYSQVAFLNNLGGTGCVLILAGTNMAGTQAASEQVFTTAKFDPILRRAIRPDGSVRPFEVLVQSTLLGNGTVDSRIVGFRTYD